MWDSKWRFCEELNVGVNVLESFLLTLGEYWLKHCSDNFTEGNSCVCNTHVLKSGVCIRLVWTVVWLYG